MTGGSSKNALRGKLAPQTLSARIELPEGEVTIVLPKTLSRKSAEKLSIWLQVAAGLEGVEITEKFQSQKI